MSAVVWPFQPRLEMIEVLEWATDVLRAKSAEQRISLRSVPKRTFQLSHLFTDYENSHANAQIREGQADGGFYVPDWGQSIAVSSVAAGSSVPLSVDLSTMDVGELAFLWESPQKFQAVPITNDSNGVTIGPVLQAYTNARLMPLWRCDAPEGLSAQRIGGRLSNGNIAMITDDGEDLSVAPPTTYRNLDVLDECPIIGGGSLEERSAWPVSVFGNSTTIAHYLRQRSIPDVGYTMRWHLFERSEQYALRCWLHYRRGRQKAFWIASRNKDFEPAASISSTTLKVFAFPGTIGIGRYDPFDIQIKTPTTHYNRRITNAALGSTISGRATYDFTMNASLTLPLSDISRISLLRCTRLDSDRIELLHRSGEGMAVQVPCIEIPEP